MSISRHEPGGRLALVVLICSAALLLPLAWPLLQGRVFVYNDLSWFHLPFRHLYQQALEKGDSLLWTPAIFSGVYFHGEGQTGVFHPLHLLLYRVLPLQAAFNLELLANYVAAFAGTWWFLRRLRFGTEPALFGAMLFAFSGFALLHHHHVNMIAVVAHLPWLLGAADVLIVEDARRPRRLAFAAVALILGSAFLIGFPQAVWWNAIALAAFAALRAGERGRWRTLLTLAAAVAIGVLLGGIQILPSADAVAHSDRAAATGAFALTYSLHPLNLLQLWSPLALTRGAHSVGDYMWFHEFGIYSGAVLPVGLAWVWTRRAALTDRRTLIVGATVFAALMLVLALGRYVGLAGLLVHLPVIGAMRAPARYVVLMQFALAILAVIAVEDLLAIREGRREPPTGRSLLPWVPTLLGVATLVGLNAGLLPYGRHTAATVAGAAPGVALVATVTLLVILAARRVRWALPALVLITAADLGVYGIGFIYREPARSIDRLMVARAAGALAPRGQLRRRAGRRQLRQEPARAARLSPDHRLRRLLPGGPTSDRRRIVAAVVGHAVDVHPGGLPASGAGRRRAGAADRRSRTAGDRAGAAHGRPAGPPRGVRARQRAGDPRLHGALPPRLDGDGRRSTDRDRPRRVPTSSAAASTRASSRSSSDSRRAASATA